MSELSYNLLRDPWIPCKMENNEFKDLSIEDVLFSATEIVEITSDNPLIISSIHRLLLAILHRVFGPRSISEWSEIYNNNQFDKKPLVDYFNEWSDKFELFNEPENRFYQIRVPEIDKTTRISKFNPAISSGNTSALFDHTWDTLFSPMSVEEAARLLVSFQNFSLGGGVAIPYNYSHAPLISKTVVLVKGSTLFETLMLNFIQYDEHHPFETSSTNEDIPFWERADKTLSEKKEGRFPYGYLDYLTWQSRRVWLIPEIVDGSIKVRDVNMTQGEKVSGDWNEDPQLIYVINDKNEKKPIKLKEDRKIWRDVEALLSLNKDGRQFISPKALDWISSLADRGIISYSKRFNLEIYGLISNKAKINSWHHSYIPLPLEFLKDQALVNNVKSFISKCEKVEKILVKTIKSFYISYLFPDAESGNLDKNQWNRVNESLEGLQVRIKYWNAIETYFFQLIDDLVAESDYPKRLEIISKWINEGVIKTASELLRSIKQNSKDDPRALKPIIQKFGKFYLKIQEIK